MEKIKEFKSKYIERLVGENSNRQHNDDIIKDSSVMNFFDIANYAKEASKEELLNICEDINFGNVSVGLDARAINFILSNKENQNVKYLAQNVNISMDIDLDSLSELEGTLGVEDNSVISQVSGSEKFSKIQEMGCKINKVYVNSGEEIAAKRGYEVNKFETIIKNSEAMYNKAISQLSKDASEEERFMAIYNAVIGKTIYDYDALNKNAGEKADTSRNLEGFFCYNGKSICAGTVEALNQLCKMNNLETQYVEGQACGVRHAWLRVKIDGKWFNADPTWDANKVGKPYQYCLKNDKEFSKDHQLDRTFKPSYQRNGKGTSVSKGYENYEFNYGDTIDSLEDKYYTDELRSRDTYNRELTEEEIEYLKSSSRADAAYMPQSIGMGKSVLEWILNILLKISTIPLKLSKMANNFVENKKNKGNNLSKITKSNVESYVKEEIEEQSSNIFSGVKLEGDELKKAESYGAKTTESEVKNQEDEEIVK